MIFSIIYNNKLRVAYKKLSSWLVSVTYDRHARATNYEFRIHRDDQKISKQQKHTFCKNWKKILLTSFHYSSTNGENCENGGDTFIYR